MRLVRLTPLLVLLASPAHAFDCAATAAQLTAAYGEKRPAASPGADISREQGACVRNAFVAGLAKAMGGPVGYKVGLTSKPAQEMFKVDAPLAGVLMADMLKPSPAKVSAAFGARPVYEADLLVRVKDAGIKDARTPEEVAAHLSEVIPFIELPDLVVAKGEPLPVGALIAINVGARAGVVGKPLPMRPELVAALGQMTVVTADGAGQELARAPGKAILGHPLNAIVWLTQALKAEGKALQPGELVSLGSFGAPQPPVAGQAITVRYEGLPGAEPVSVRFD